MGINCICTVFAYDRIGDILNILAINLQIRKRLQVRRPASLHYSNNDHHRLNCVLASGEGLTHCKT